MRALLLGLSLLVTSTGADTPALDSTPLQLSGDLTTRKLNPIFLPDGRTILFGGLVDGNWGLFVRSPNGSVRRWVASRAWEGAPALWRKAGRVAFERFDRNRGASEMWTARPDGSDERRIGDQPGFRPEPSPDGRRLAFDNAVEVEPRRRTHQMFVVAGNGPLRRLTQTLSYDAAPTWSPDGKRIAFDSQRDDTNRDFNAARSEIYVMNSDGSGQRRLSFLNGRSRYASWSPRSDAIVFEALIAGNSDLYMLRANRTSPPVRLTMTSGSERTPSWSEDGRRLLYTYEADGKAELRTITLPERLR